MRTARIVTEANIISGMKTKSEEKRREKKKIKAQVNANTNQTVSSCGVFNQILVQKHHHPRPDDIWIFKQTLIEISLR